MTNETLRAIGEFSSLAVASLKIHRKSYGWGVFWFGLFIITVVEYLR